MSKAQLIYGFHAVIGRLRQNAQAVVEIFVDGQRADPRTQRLVRLAEEHGKQVLVVDSHRLDGLTGRAAHQGVVARVERASRPVELRDIMERPERAALLLVLDCVQDPRNLGACLRVADAMGVDAVIAPKDRAVGITPTVEEVACGAARTIPYITVTNLARSLNELKESGFWLYGADSSGKIDLSDAKLSAPLGWVLGAEDRGLRRLTREACDTVVRIPMLGTVESVNVAVASGIVLFETRRQWR
jgi:23S rRNA (guanosine2251-2'-O)-methyltransferase